MPLDDPATATQAATQIVQLGTKDFWLIILGSSGLSALVNILFWFTQKRFESGWEYEKQIRDHRLEALLRLKALSSPFNQTVTLPDGRKYLMFLFMEPDTQRKYLATLSQFLEEKGMWLGSPLEQTALDFTRFFKDATRSPEFLSLRGKDRENLAAECYADARANVDTLLREIRREAPKLKRVDHFLKSLKNTADPEAKAGRGKTKKLGKGNQNKGKQDQSAKGDQGEVPEQDKQIGEGEH
jgi:hypothetical protein